MLDFAVQARSVAAQAGGYQLRLLNGTLRAARAVEQAWFVVHARETAKQTPNQDNKSPKIRRPDRHAELVKGSRKEDARCKSFGGSWGHPAMACFMSFMSDGFCFCALSTTENLTPATYALNPCRMYSCLKRVGSAKQGDLFCRPCPKKNKH